KLQNQTQFLRRRTCVFDSPKKRKKKLLQGPASLEITRKPSIWFLQSPVTGQIRSWTKPSTVCRLTRHEFEVLVLRLPFSFKLATLILMIHKYTCPTIDIPLQPFC